MSIMRTSAPERLPQSVTEKSPPPTENRGMGKWLCICERYIPLMPEPLPGTSPRDAIASERNLLAAPRGIERPET